MKLLIKNMVCDRCRKVVRDELENAGLQVIGVELGEVEISEEPTTDQLQIIETILQDNGFELLVNKKVSLVESIKTLIIDEVQHLKGNKPEHMNFSDYLAMKSGYEYSYISHLFSSETGMTLEQFLIAQRIEKVKEWLSYDELSVSEIAWKLGYSSTAHLSNQFKKITGLTPVAYKTSTIKNRISLDKISQQPSSSD